MHMEWLHSLQIMHHWKLQGESAILICEAELSSAIPLAENLSCSFIDELELALLSSADITTSMGIFVSH